MIEERQSILHPLKRSFQVYIRKIRYFGEKTKKERVTKHRHRVPIRLAEFLADQVMNRNGTNGTSDENGLNCDLSDLFDGHDGQIIYNFKFFLP
jgi:hypothetical protein